MDGPAGPGEGAGRILRSERLDLLPFTAELIDAMIDADDERLRAITGARFSGGIVPPLMDDHLADLRDLLRSGQDPLPWRAWLAIDRTSGEAVGSAGGGGVPDANGTVSMGWAVFPKFEGKGYGTEAAQAVLEALIQQPGVQSVMATVPPDHIASIRIAEKIGMHHTGEAVDAEVGRVLVYEISAEISSTR